MRLSPSLSPFSGQDKRATPRKGSRVRCWVEDPVCLRYARLQNVSRGGAKVETAGPPAPGTRIVIRFELIPGRGTAVAKAYVVWNSMVGGGRGGAMGVQFIDVSDMRQLDDYLEHG